MSLVCLFAVFHLEAYTITTFRGSWTLIMIAASLHCRCRSSRRSRDVCIFYTKTALWQRRDCQQLSSLWRQAVCCKFSLFANQTKRMRSQHDNFVIATVMSMCISFCTSKNVVPVSRAGGSAPPIVMVAAPRRYVLLMRSRGTITCSTYNQ